MKYLISLLLMVTLAACSDNGENKGNINISDEQYGAIEDDLDKLINDSNKAITSINYSKDLKFITIYVNESLWANSTKSEKASFVANVDRLIINKIKEKELIKESGVILTTFKSDTAQDTIAEPKTFSSGHDIIR